MEGSNQQFTRNEQGKTVLKYIRDAIPGVSMLISCFIGVLLIFEANTHQDKIGAEVYVMYFFGSIFLLPSLILFFNLYQKLLRPSKAFLLDTFDADTVDEV